MADEKNAPQPAPSAPSTAPESAAAALPGWAVAAARVLGFLLLAAAALAAAWALIAGGFRDVVLRLVHDDAFYYFQIARNMAAGAGSTFDGISSTNGYHPLWQWLLVPVAAVAGDNATLARVASVLGVALLVAAALLLSRTLRLHRYTMSAFPLWWVAAAFVPATVYGLESPLAAFFFALLVWLEARDENSRRKGGMGRGLLLGVVSSFLFLARIDALMWVAAMDLVIMAEARRGRRAPDFLRGIFVVQALLIGGYFAMNWALWGHPLTISALVKSGRAGWFPLDFPWSLLCVLAFLTVPLSLWALARRAELAWIGGGNLLYLLLIVARGGRETFNWYFTLPALSAAVLIPCFIEENTGRLPRRLAAFAAFALALAVLAVGVRGKALKPSKFLDRYDMARALAAQPPGRYTLALTDCGIVGALSRQRCINLDGLTGSFAFQDALARDGGFTEWLRTTGLNACVVEKTASAPATVALVARPGIARVGREAALTVAPGPLLADRWQIMTVTGIGEPGASRTRSESGARERKRQ